MNTKRIVKRIAGAVAACALLCLGETIQAQGTYVMTPAFTPNIPSSSSQPVDYTYEFWVYPAGDMVSDEIYGELEGGTSEIGYTGTSPSWTKVVDRGVAKHDFHAYYACGTLPPVDCTVSQTETRYPTPTTYSPSSGTSCYSSYSGGALYSSVYAYYSSLDAASLVTKSSSGTGWTLEYTHSTSIPYMYFYKIGSRTCPGTSITEWGRIAGHGAYYKIHVTLTAGTSPSVVPLPSLPSAWVSTGSTANSSSSDYFEIYNPSFNGAGRFQFTVNGSGSTFDVQSSTDLSTWSTLSSGVTYTGGAYAFTDVGSASITTRFYRVKTASGAIYSANTLGFNRISKASGKNLILLSSQFNIGDNSLDALIPGVPNGTVASVWNPGTAGYDTSTYSTTDGWSNPNLVLKLGAGFWLNSSSAIGVPLYGYVQKGTTSLTVPNVSTPMGSMLPRAGTIQGLSFPLRDADTFYKWDVSAQSYVSSQYFYPEDIWSPSAPSVGISEGFIYNGNTGTPPTWSQTY